MKLGTAKQDITCFIPGIGMMGYGQFHNIVKEIATPLWGRALVLEEDGKKFILVHLEQAFITLAIREEVLKRLQVRFPDWNMTYDNLVMTAQHTHSAPGGYSHYPMYNFTIPNFQTRVFEKIVSTVLETIKEASENLEDVSMSWGSTKIDESKEVAFNRSMTAHSLNGEATFHNESEKHLAVDRVMDGLKFTTTSGKVKAFLNWFGVHNTSVSSFNQKIHHDNKGVAASLYEARHPGTLAFFLQASAGDVSPNFIWDKSTKLMRGKFKDQYESAAFNGEIQFRESEKINCDKPIQAQMSSHHIFMDMAQEVAPPAHGVGFFKGTLEGPGVSKELGSILGLISKFVKKKRLIHDPVKHKHFYESHGTKEIILDHRDGSFLGIPLDVWKVLPPLPEPTLEALRKTAKKNALETLPWIPSILPFQVLRLGNLLILFSPGEISVMSGRRLKSFLLSELEETGIDSIILTTYANAYMGYVVTPEEYDKQCYEGGHCVYGRNTLYGIIKGFTYLSDILKGGEKPLTLPKEPFHFPADELARRCV